jgi:hypothetical protein
VVTGNIFHLHNWKWNVVVVIRKCREDRLGVETIADVLFLLYCYYSITYIIIKMENAAV